MPRFIFLSLCLIFCCFLQACQQGKVQEKQKIGVVNINRIMVESNVGKAAAKYIEGVQNSLRNQLTALQNKTESASSKEKVDAANQELLQKQVQIAYAKMQTEQQNVQNILNDVLHRTVEKFRKQNGYTMILFSDVVLSFEESVDVTTQITAAMDTEKVEFKPASVESDEKPVSEQKENTK